MNNKWLWWHWEWPRSALVVRNRIVVVLTWRSARTICVWCGSLFRELWLALMSLPRHWQPKYLSLRPVVVCTGLWQQLERKLCRHTETEQRHREEANNFVIFGVVIYWINVAYVYRSCTTPLTGSRDTQLSSHTFRRHSHVRALDELWWWSWCLLKYILSIIIYQPLFAHSVIEWVPTYRKWISIKSHAITHSCVIHMHLISPSTPNDANDGHE